MLRPEECAAILDGLATRRRTVVAGPSGSGKSALVWRTARLVERGPQIVRVLRAADADDVELLVSRPPLMPTLHGPVLVCADDLGRARMAAWPDARRRLSELSGVLILGAVRREDLTPEISADAAIVDPRLTDTGAGQIYDAIATAGLPTVLEREEALQQAEGLLMEFIALTTTGRRIRDVLAVQVAALADPTRRLQREALRLVCAAHTLGFAVAADALPAALGAEPDQVGDALDRLNGEHLLVRMGQAWQGLHDLRTELLLDLLHTTPPPTLAATYGRVLAVLPQAARAVAARRAAVRLARSTATDDTGALRCWTRLPRSEDDVANPAAGRTSCTRTRPTTSPSLRHEVRAGGITVRIARKGIESSQRLGRHRWIVESCLSWLLRNRRLVRRYDRKAEHFQAFADLAAALLSYRRLAKATK